MYISRYSLDSFFNEALEPLQCQETTRSYIVSIYTKYRNSNHDLSKDSITLLYSQAKYNHDFETYQNIGDWIFFSNTIIPGHLNAASPDYYHTVGRLSYHSCFKIINRQWVVYEELADKFVQLEKEAKILLDAAKRR